MELGNTFDGMVFDMDQDVMAQYADDSKLAAFFYARPVKNNSKTKVQGRPIFDEEIYIKILTPGSKDTFETLIQMPEGYDPTFAHEDSDPYAENLYVRRFPKQWDSFKKKKDQLQSGTPIDALGWLTVSQIAEFRAVNVHTVEQLVGMSDAASARFMGHHQIKTRAKAYLDALAGAAPALEMQAALESRDEQIAELQRQMAELFRANKELAANQAKQPVTA